MNTEHNNAIDSLVSIVMPTYNCAEFIGITIESVLLQTYVTWELLIVDDCSTDNSKAIIEKYSKDTRIKYLKMNTNSGAAQARNRGIEQAKGEFIAFLDSDDTWESNKLSKQISFMRANNYNFTCTNYNKINEQGESLNKIITAIEISDYDGVLKTCPGNSTVIYNAKKLGKFIIPNIKKRNDYVMWLQIIKKSQYLYGLQENLASHRIREGSLSKNKFDLVKYHWKVYREIEKLTFIKSVYLELYWIIITAFKLRR